FNPATGLVYLPASQNSFVYGIHEAFEFVPNAWNLGIDLPASWGMRPGADPLPESEYEPGTGPDLGAASALVAWDPVAGRARWTVPYPDAAGGGTLTTAGNLVFQGTDTGKFIAYSADRGEKLWEMDL